MKESAVLNTERYFKRVTCRLCDSPATEKVMDYVATPVGDHFITKDKINEKQDVYPLDLFLASYPILSLTALVPPL